MPRYLEQSLLDVHLSDMSEHAKIHTAYAFGLLDGLPDGEKEEALQAMISHLEFRLNDGSLLGLVKDGEAN